MKEKEISSREKRRSVTYNPALACDLQLMPLIEDYEHVQDGDIIIGGVFTVNNKIMELISPNDIMKVNRNHKACIGLLPHDYNNVLIFLFAIELLNASPDILPNITLGYHFYDSCLDPSKAVKSVLQILSGPRKTVPNYSCMDYNKVAGFIGDHHSKTTIPIAQILGIYGFTQISYGATDYSLSDRRIYPHFFRMIQNYHTHYKMIAQLVKHFGWTWVGIIMSYDDSGETESRVLINYLNTYGICVAFKENDVSRNIEGARHITHYSPVADIGQSRNITGYSPVTDIGCAWHIVWLIKKHARVEAELKDSCNREQGYNWSTCVCNKTLKFMAREFGPIICDNLPGVTKCGEKVEQYGNCDFVVIYVIRMFSGNFKWTSIIIKKLHHYLKDVIFMMYDVEKTFDEYGECRSYYRILNWYQLPNQTTGGEEVGKFTMWATEGQQLNINSQSIIWRYKDNQIPRSQCSESCLPGYRKVLRPGIQTCCYDCVWCSEGEISNTSDSENCIICPDDEWPNEKKDQCLPKVVEFLSYTNDAIAVVSSFVSSVFCFLTVIILLIFIVFRNTPIVKANNQNLSFLLLVSIMLSFLCVFLFLGRPVDITCMLRQTSFGICFSTAISSVLGKTIMIYIVFKATKPGSAWGNWVTVKVPNSVVFMCSSLQVLVNIIWLAISPPFQELDTQSYPGKMIIQCNEGSVIAFYTVLGYMGFLAAVSFIIAFLARTLPDSFNEAKYITFSMLVFCSVWIAMIPAYLSTKGKYMVAVEIFAILSSSAGLLGCIFLPKCYIIMFRPEINTKCYLFGIRHKTITS
ncbi:vomeronasal type-2 receptor 26-like [Pelodytes ibericus]